MLESALPLSLEQVWSAWFLEEVYHRQVLAQASSSLSSMTHLLPLTLTLMKLPLRFQFSLVLTQVGILSLPQQQVLLLALQVLFQPFALLTFRVSPPLWELA